MTKRIVALIAVIAALAATAAALPSDNEYEIAVEFDRTYNLFPGSPVRVLGVEVGQVKEVSVSPDTEKVRVELIIEEGIDLPADVRAVIIPQSLLGERYVQLDPAYTGGAVLEDGAVIPNDRTIVPAEFDEILESLNTFAGGLDEAELARMVDNVATVIEGQGAPLGNAIDNAHEAVKVLQNNDDELIRLASRLADLNETLSTRDRAIVAIIDDWNTVARHLADERNNLEGALGGLVRLTREVANLLERQRPGLQRDIEVLTRVGRTASRNLDELSLLVMSGSELFRHAQRGFDYRRNWLPLVNHTEGVEAALALKVAERLEFACDSIFPAEVCDQVDFNELLTGGDGELCLPPVIPCADEGVTTLSQGLRQVFEAHPDLIEAFDNSGSTAPPAPAVPDVHRFQARPDAEGDDDGEVAP